MEKMIQSDVRKQIWKMILAASCSVLSFHQILTGYYTLQNILLTLAAAFLCAYWFATKTWEENSGYIGQNIRTSVIILILVSCTVWKEYQSSAGVRRDSLKVQMPVNFFRIRWYLFSIVFLWYFAVWLYRRMKDLLQNIWSQLDQLDRKTYAGLTIALGMIIAFAYLFQPMWYLQYDRVYSVDSGWCFHSIYPQAAYYDIRHPILSLVTFPVWAVTDSFLSFCAPENLREVLCAVFIQFLNVQLLLFVGLILRIITRSRLVFLLYMASFPTMLFSMSLEKYQICIFWLVLYVYQVCKDMDSPGGTFIMTAGMMPTNGLIGICELFINRPFLAKMKNIAEIFLHGLAVLVCTGRVHLLNFVAAYQEIMEMKNSFGGSLTIRERTISVTKMIQSSFLALSSDASGNYLWRNVTSGVSVLCAVIIVLMIVGAFSNWHIKFVRIACLWTAFSFVLFVILNWSPQESPLFAILFSWALIPLFQMGVDFLIKKFGMNVKIVYGCIVVTMLVVNLTALMDIHRFLYG